MCKRSYLVVLLSFSIIPSSTTALRPAGWSSSQLRSVPPLSPFYTSCRVFRVAQYSRVNDEALETEETFLLTQHSRDDEGQRAAISSIATDHDPSSGTPSSQPQFSFDFSAQSIWLLNLVAVLWGTQHAVIKICVQDGNAAGPFTLLRFGLAAMLASPYTPGLWSSTSPSIASFSDSTEDNADNSTDSRLSQTWRWGLEMGFWMFLGFAFQAIGLEYTTAQKSGFLLYLNVKFVPILAFLLLGRSISVPTLASAVTAFTGTALLATSGRLVETMDTAAAAAQASSWNIGDIWSIAAALVSAMFILRLERASAQVKDAAGLNAACLWVVTALAGVWTGGSILIEKGSSYVQQATVWEQVWNIASTHTLELFYLSGVTTALANWIQTKAQRDVSAERASVIYAMDPVYGAIFSYLLLGEELNGIQAWLGAAMIAVAAATNAILEPPSTDKKMEFEN